MNSLFYFATAVWSEDCGNIRGVKRGTLERTGLLTSPQLDVDNFHDNPNTQGKKKDWVNQSLGILHFDIFYFV